MATKLDLSKLDGSNGFRMDGINKYDALGYSVSSAGDVNGDGFDDLIIGAPRADSHGFSSGSSYVVFGKASGFGATLDLSGLDGNNGFQLEGEEISFSGSSVSTAGDINGDGFDDLIIGAPYAGPNGDWSAGSSYLIFGKASGFDASLELSDLNGSNGFRLDAEGAAGRSVNTAGDINDDGFDDLIIGAWRASPNGNSSGSSYVVFGKASGFVASLDLSSLNGNNGFRLDGEYDSHSGRSVSTAGDINGDGFDDLIIGVDPNGSIPGSSYVVFGKADGFDAAMNLSSLNGSNSFRLIGSGHSVSGAGDINGDGFDDLLVGAPAADPNGSNSGSGYVVFGKASGFDAPLDLSGLDGSDGFRLDGLAAYDSLGFSVSDAGDVNGDGLDDLIIGSYESFLPYGYESPIYGAGSSYVVFGKTSGFEATLDLSSLDGSNGFQMNGMFGDGLLGWSVSGAGDINDDGYDDLIIGAPKASPNSNWSAGSSYVVFGRSDFSGSELPTIPGTSGDDVLRGALAAEIIEAGDGNDVLIGHGGADVFRGGAGVDQIKVPDLNFESIDGGAGTDILHLDGRDLNLDLANFGGKIKGIETICIYGRGDNTLVLTADSVLNLSDTSNTLKLHGNAGDRVAVQDDGWADSGVKGFYRIYTNEDAVLLVGANLTIDFV